MEYKAHECEWTKERKYSVVRLGVCYVTLPEAMSYTFGLYDKLTHSYVWSITFCPGCGGDLIKEAR